MSTAVTMHNEMSAAPHLPVLRQEVLQWLAPRDGGNYCDATVGFGGHAEAVLKACGPSGRLWGLDRDQDALASTAARLKPFGDRVQLIKTPFSRLKEALATAGAPPLDGCLVDLGVSSPQLDRAERGFSFRNNGPLDMRMDQTSGITAEQYLADVSESELTDVLRDLGEERFARSIARAIVAERAAAPISDTARLASIVARAVPSRERHKDPATRTFQALRIAINQELGELERFLAQAPGCLAPGGRLVVIAFHSLEDRMVKQAFRDLGGREPSATGTRVQILTKHVVWPSDEECRTNPRSRSARLRAVERIES